MQKGFGSVPRILLAETPPAGQTSSQFLLSYAAGPRVGFKGVMARLPLPHVPEPQHSFTCVDEAHLGKQPRARPTARIPEVCG